MVGGFHHRKHLDLGERGLPAALVVERTDPHQPVGALLDRQRAVGVRRVHRERRTLDAGLFGVGGVEHLDGIFVRLGPPDIHPHQHLGPVRGVHSTGPGADVDQRLALVVLAREQGADLHRLDVLTQLGQLRVGLGAFLVTTLFGGEFVEHRQVLDALAQLLDPAQFVLRVGQLAGHLLGMGLVVPQAGVGGLGFERFDAGAQTFDIEHPLHGRQRGVEGSDIGMTVWFHGCRGYRPLPPTRPSIGGPRLRSVVVTASGDDATAPCAWPVSLR